MIFESILTLWILYIIGIQYKRKGFWYCVFPIAFIAWLFDILLNYTVLAILTWDRPRKNEFTFSKRLERLVHDKTWRGSLADFIATYLLDPFDPAGFHIDRNKYNGELAVDN